MELTRCGTATDGKVDVIFVHGLGGDHRDTWTAHENSRSVFWPDALATRLGSEARVWSLAYAAPVLRVSERGRLREILGTDVTSLIAVLLNNQIGDRPIVFVTHSLGGLVVKALLRRADEARQHDEGSPARPIVHRIAAMTRAVVFLATPHCGSSLTRLTSLTPLIAKVGTAGLATGLALLIVVPKLLLVGLPTLLRWVLRPSQYLEQLAADDPYLRDLADSYRRFAERMGLDTVAYYERRPVLGVHVVTPCSADPGLPQSSPIGVDANHVGISKMGGASIVFKGTEDLVRRVSGDSDVGKERSLFEVRLQEQITDLLHDPQLEPLRPAFEHADANGTRRVRVPKRFTNITDRENLRVYFEGQLRLRLRRLFEDRRLHLTEAAIQTAEQSVYDLDKYVLYLWREYNLRRDFEALHESIDSEARRIKDASPADGPPSLIPLYRAARALEHALEDDLQRSLHGLREAHEIVLEQRGRFTSLDSAHETRDLLQRLERSLTGLHNTAEAVRTEQRKDREDRRAAQGEDLYASIEGKISDPQEGQTVGKSHRCAGTVTGMVPGLSLRLAIEADGLVWPKERNIRIDDDRWSANLYEEGKDSKTFSLSLYVIDAETDRRILRWLRTGSETGSYPGWTGMAGARRIARVDDLRRKSV